MPAYNASLTIGAALESLLGQDYTNLEIVVISDGSSDDTVKVAKRLDPAHITVIDRRENEGLAATLIEGLEQTRGPVIMFLHSDCQFEPSSWISQAVGHFEDPNVGWVTGYYETLRPESTHMVDQAFAVLRGELLLRYRDGNDGIWPIPFSEGKCDLLRREVITDIGGIPQVLRRSGEDQLLSYAVRRKGWKIVKDSSLGVQQLYVGEEPFALISGNLKKEFMHGKTQAVINLLHWRTVARDITNSSFAMRKGLHPVFKLAAFVVTLASVLSAIFTGNLVGLVPMLVFLGLLGGYYIGKCHYSGTRVFSSLTPLVVVLGFASYMPYGIGLVWGMLRFLLMKARIYTTPI